MITILRKLSDVLKEYPNFKPEWKVIEETLLDGTKIVMGIENPNFGKVERVVICEEDGSQYMINIK